MTPLQSTAAQAAASAAEETQDAAADVLRFLVTGALVASAIALVVLMSEAGLRVDPGAAGTLPFYGLGLVALALRFGVASAPWRHARAIGEGAEYVAVFIGMALMGALASYPIAALTRGYADAMLQRADLALHFDWVAWYRTVAAHRWLQIAGTGAYRSIFFTPAVLLGYYAYKRQRLAAWRFLASFWLAAAITLAAFSLMPAVGPFSYLWHAPIRYMPESEVWQAGLIPLLRAHRVADIDLAHMVGLVSAPSFHAAAATLYIVAGWRTRSLRWPLLALNAAMLLSTPVEGTHYLIDLVMGACVAIAAICAVDALVRRLAPPPLPQVALA